MMTIEYVWASGWWVKIAGTCVVWLDLPKQATPTEVRTFAAQTLAGMVEKAEIFAPHPIEQTAEPRS